MKGMQDFLDAHKELTLTSRRVSRNPDMADSDSTDHWKCILDRAGTPFVRLFFSKGYAHHGAQPELDEVLDCLASDATGIENARSFDEWCGEYGYDTDSRRAERTYKLCCKQAERLRNLLGPSAYAALLWETDRL